MPKEPSRRLVKSLLRPYHSLLLRLAGDGDRAFFEPDSFPWIAEIERSWRTIRDEADAVVKEPERLPLLLEVEPGQDDIADERWKSFVLFIYGREIPENTGRCPRTTALLRRVPEVTTAMFSVLEPGSRVPPHHGPFKGVLRLHLGLRVPRDARSGIRVDGELREWVEGSSLVFDDTFEHEVWNESDEPRVVLFVDFLRPLRWPLSALNRLLMEMARWTPAVRRAQANARRLAPPRGR
jgi:aspartyl/asparaginyl beta-hydroxylase (cupin superfamily)